MVNRPDAVVMRIQGVLVPASFDAEADTFAVTHVQEYLSEKKGEKVTGLLLQRLREDAALDRDSGLENVPQIPAAADVDQQIVAAVQYMQWSLGRSPVQHPFAPVTLLKHSICKEGMAAGRLQTPVWEDAVRNMRAWRFGQHFIKCYTLDVPDSEDQERLFTHSASGDIRDCIANYIRLGQADKALLPRTYRTIVAMIRTEPANILFVTNSRSEAAVAAAQHLTVVLLRRPGEPLPANDGQQVPVPQPHDLPVATDFDHIKFIHDPNRPAACC